MDRYSCRYRYMKIDECLHSRGTPSRVQRQAAAAIASCHQDHPKPSPNPRPDSYQLPQCLLTRSSPFVFHPASPPARHLTWPPNRILVPCCLQPHLHLSQPVLHAAESNGTHCEVMNNLSLSNCHATSSSKSSFKPPETSPNFNFSVPPRSHLPPTNTGPPIPSHSRLPEFQILQFQYPNFQPSQILPCPCSRLLERLSNAAKPETCSKQPASKDRARGLKS